jgi:hypothetical protein
MSTQRRPAMTSTLVTFLCAVGILGSVACSVSSDVGEITASSSKGRHVELRCRQEWIRSPIESRSPMRVGHRRVAPGPRMAIMRRCLNAVPGIGAVGSMPSPSQRRRDLTDRGNGGAQGAGDAHSLAWQRLTQRAPSLATIPDGRPRRMVLRTGWRLRQRCSLCALATDRDVPLCPLVMPRCL